MITATVTFYEYPCHRLYFRTGGKGDWIDHGSHQTDADLDAARSELQRRADRIGCPIEFKALTIRNDDDCMNLKP